MILIAGRLWRGDRVVEYETPPNSDGLGTETGAMRKNLNPIHGVVILYDAPLITRIL
jgi:hypothetical protein